MRAPDTVETDLYAKTVWLCAELTLLAGVFTEATTKLEAARAAGSFAGVRSAFLDLEKFTDQASQLTDSLQIAIENENGRRVKS